MMKRILYRLFSTLLLVITACDSGDIYPEETPTTDTYTVSVVVAFQNTETVPEARADDPDKFERKLILAAYTANATSPSALTHLKRTNVVENVTDTFQVLYVPQAATMLKLAIADQRNSIIYTLAEADLSGATENIILNWNTVDLVPYGRVQEQLFDQSCITCHKAGSGSAGLSLNEASSYAMIVGQTSKTDTTMCIIEAGRPNASMMYLRLTDATVGHYNHTTLSTLKENDVELLKAWIEDGAKNN